jgi:prepilin-type processing-associated H-X9-DG protein
MAIGGGVDLTNWEGYDPGKSVYRHTNRAMVGWLDGHAKAHFPSYVDRLENQEDGEPLILNDRLLYWNLR